MINTIMRISDFFTGPKQVSDPYGAAGTHIDANYNPESFKYAEMERKKYKEGEPTPVYTKSPKMKEADKWLNRESPDRLNAGIRGQEAVYRRIGPPNSPKFPK